jgi:peptide/nickel transport system substrate-binding protein
MLRRTLLKGAAAAAFTIGAAPRVARADRSKTLVFVPTSDLTVLDPIVTFNRPTRNYAYLVFDTLYGLDTDWQAQPQMVAGHEVDNDGLTWVLKLRDGLRFHDNEPVLARDVVASIRRFTPRIPFVSVLMNATDGLSAPDDKTVQFRLKRAFPRLPMALAGPGGTMPAIMPERLASTSSFQPVSEVIGSGPFSFLKDEHVSGARAAFARFEQYRPREGGGSRVHLGAESGAFRPGRMDDTRHVLRAGRARPGRDRLVGAAAARSRRAGRAESQHHGCLALRDSDRYPPV